MDKERIGQVLEAGVTERSGVQAAKARREAVLAGSIYRNGPVGAIADTSVPVKMVA